MILGMCAMLCFGTMAFAMLSGAPHGAVTYMQPLEGAEGITPPVMPRSHRPFGMGHQHFGPFGIIFFMGGMAIKVLLFGLMIMLLLGLMRGFCGRHWHKRAWRHHHGFYGPPPPWWDMKAKAADAEDTEDFCPEDWAKWAKHCHGGHWSPPWGSAEPEQPEPEEEPQTEE